jgi:crossover junction endodeoxyribonuclease RusA
MRITFTVQGTPAPQGSMRGFIRNGRVNMTSANKQTMPWRQAVAAAASQACRGSTWPTTKAGAIELQFNFPRPKWHLNSKGAVKPSAPPDKTTKPDIDKLQRAILDALAGIVYVDDAQVYFVQALKRYIGWNPHAVIVVMVGDASEAKAVTP